MIGSGDHERLQVAEGAVRGLRVRVGVKRDTVTDLPCVHVEITTTHNALLGRDMGEKRPSPLEYLNRIGLRGAVCYHHGEGYGEWTVWAEGDIESLQIRDIVD